MKKIERLKRHEFCKNIPKCERQFETMLRNKICFRREHNITDWIYQVPAHFVCVKENQSGEVVEFTLMTYTNTLDCENIAELTIYFPKEVENKEEFMNEKMKEFEEYITSISDYCLIIVLSRYMYAYTFKLFVEFINKALSDHYGKMLLINEPCFLEYLNDKEIVETDLNKFLRMYDGYKLRAQTQACELHHKKIYERYCTRPKAIAFATMVPVASRTILISISGYFSRNEVR